MKSAGMAELLPRLVGRGGKWGETGIGRKKVDLVSGQQTPVCTTSETRCVVSARLLRQAEGTGRIQGRAAMPRVLCVLSTVRENQPPATPEEGGKHK